MISVPLPRRRRRSAAERERVRDGVVAEAEGEAAGDLLRGHLERLDAKRRQFDRIQVDAVAHR